MIAKLPKYLIAAGQALRRNATNTGWEAFTPADGASLQGQIDALTVRVAALETPPVTVTVLRTGANYAKWVLSDVLTSAVDGSELTALTVNGESPFLTLVSGGQPGDNFFECEYTTAPEVGDAYAIASSLNVGGLAIAATSGTVKTTPIFAESLDGGTTVRVHFADPLTATEASDSLAEWASGGEHPVSMGPIIPDADNYNRGYFALTFGAPLSLPAPLTLISQPPSFSEPVGGLPWNGTVIDNS